MNILDMARQYEDDIIEQRRYFHKYPEAAWEEVQTTIAIENQLRSIGLKPVRFEDISGVYTEIKGERACGEGKTLLLRADIDGVLVKEETGLPYASVNYGLMHATGRDCHIAMMLGAAKILHELRHELAGNVRILFQAAEESAQGAKEYIRRGIMRGVDAVYAAHVYGGLEASSIDVTPGYRMASADKFVIEIAGLTAYASLPHLGRDAIVAAADVIGAVQTYVARRNNPLNPLVITIGTIQGGKQRNLVADHVRMEGTVRTHCADRRKSIEGELREIIEHTAQANGCQAQLHYQYMLPPLENDARLSAIAARAVRELFGEAHLAHLPPLMSSEDFSSYGENAPCIYANLGCANQALGWTHSNYSGKFRVDESILMQGAALCAQFTVDYLQAAQGGSNGKATEIL